jgi:hypothetical protein
MRTAIVNLVLAGMVLIFLFGCKGSKEIPKAQKASLEEILNGLKQNQISYEFFSAKAKVSFEGEEMRMGGRANIRMIKDSLIWMNFKKLSVEGSRALITRDSFWIVYRLDKMYESGTFNELMEAYDMEVSFAELQDLIVGNFPVPLSNEIGRYATKKTHDLYFYQNATQYEYQMDGNFKMRSFLLKDILGRTISGVYNDYSIQNFSSKKDLQVHLEDGTTARINMDFSDVEFDEPRKIQFEVPTNYYRLP